MLQRSSTTAEADAGIVEADGESLSHAIRNVLDNAVKYSPGTRVIDVSVRPAGSSLCIAVADSGIGIPAREQPDIFGRFTRGQAAIRLGMRGTGLGLAIVTQIVRAHHGTVEVTSAESVGSTFTIRLPRADAHPDLLDQGRLAGSTGSA